jgi:hypothetical protein
MLDMIKQLTAFIFLVAFMAHTFNRAVIVFDYYTNTAAFAKNCENKARPQMHCNGKCQMMKKLQQEEKKDQSNPERKMENKNEVVAERSLYPAIVYDPAIIISQFPSFNIGTPIDIAGDFFHPPGV